LIEEPRGAEESIAQQAREKKNKKQDNMKARLFCAGGRGLKDVSTERRDGTAAQKLAGQETIASAGRENAWLSCSARRAVSWCLELAGAALSLRAVLSGVRHSVHDLEERGASA